MTNSVMTERPILFNEAMVRAILEGRKTQTRRPVKPQPREEKILGLPGLVWKNKHWAIGDLPKFITPYGQPGDRLWVREAMRQSDEDGLCYTADGKPLGKWPDEYCYRNLDVATIPSIHMPRWASRITLEITNVRVERLQEITEHDAEREGTFHTEIAGVSQATNLLTGETTRVVTAKRPFTSARKMFEISWNDIYAARGLGWDNNPWVWVVEFKRI